MRQASDACRSSVVDQKPIVHKSACKTLRSDSEVCLRYHVEAHKGILKVCALSHACKPLRVCTEIDFRLHFQAEYGNPDTDDWKYLQTYSPYHNVDEKVSYPPILVTTSTRDDRVHPGVCSASIIPRQILVYFVSFPPHLGSCHARARQILACHPCLSAAL